MRAVLAEPLLSGGDENASSARDIEYVRDLGRVAHDGPLQIANPVYAEVIPREFTYAVQETFMDRCDAKEGHLVLFDRTEGKPWADKLFRREEPMDGGAVTVWGM